MYAALGEVETNYTVTPGGGPNLHAEDAVPSYVASVAKGELTITDFSDLVSDGEDIVQNFHVKCLQLPLKQLPLSWSPFSPQLLEVLKITEPAPLFVRSPLYQTINPVSDCLKIGIFLSAHLDPA